jgi:hypothetical protein
MFICKFLPFENYVLTSKLTPAEVHNCLSGQIESPKSFSFSLLHRESNKPYEGEILENTFTIQRIIDYRNSFLPIIKGNISTSLGETYIKITMRPAIFVMIFISFWLGIIGIVCLCMLWAGIRQIDQISMDGFSPVVLIPFGMFMFGYLLTIFGFKVEAKKSKAFLASLLKGF